MSLAARVSIHVSERKDSVLLLDVDKLGQHIDDVRRGAVVESASVVLRACLSFTQDEADTIRYDTIQTGGIHTGVISVTK